MEIKNKEEIFEKLCDEFDFSMTKEIMEYIDWPWYAGHSDTPIVDMRKLIKRLFDDLLELIDEENMADDKSGVLYVSTAGFTISYKYGIFDLMFIPVHSQIVIEN